MASFWKRPQPIWWRKCLLQIHLWAGLITGLYVLVISVSGAALVFHEEMLAAAYVPVVSQAPGSRIGWDALHERMIRLHPGFQVSWFRNRENPREAIEVWLERDATRKIILADAVTGEVLGPKGGLVDSSLQWLADLHISLLSGQTGRIVNGVGAGFLCLLCVTGAIIWWPGIQNWRRSLSVSGGKSWKRINWDLHSATGAWSFIFVTIWAVTGVYFTFPQPFRSLVGMIAPLQKPASRPPGAAPPASASLAPVSTLVAAADRATPGKVTTWVGLPYRKGQRVAQVYRQDSFDAHAPILGVALDAYSAEVSQIRDFENLLLGDRLLRWLGYLHFGNFGGAPVKVLWTVLGLAPALLFVTGFLMWWNRVLSKRWRAWQQRPSPRFSNHAT
ncbi:MAG TPA: PepSY-associated TM helix domain-containing protein [Bryobacteraceae bacterium]|nr:PepSY-associated TM helix domain-containing protein [Bryobacteraceae bacterium]